MEKDLVGVIALCSKDMLGVITGYDEKRKVWVGYQLEKNPGSSWESSRPRLLTTLKRLRDMPQWSISKDFGELLYGDDYGRSGY